MKSRESKRNIMIFHSPNSLCLSQRGNNTPSTNPTKSREKHQQSRNPKTQIETSSTRIKKPKDPDRNIINKNQETHPKIQRETSTNPSLLPPKPFVVAAWVWSLVCFLCLRSLGLFFCLCNLGLFFVGRRTSKIEPYKLDLYSPKSSLLHLRC